MNTRVRFILTIVVFTHFFSCQKATNQEAIICNSLSKPIDTYIFPLRPGVIAFDTLYSGDKKLAACQIPDSALNKISTSGLVQTWLDFPLASDIFLGNSLQQGVNYFMVNFSGLKELSKRLDAGEVMYSNFYNKMNPKCISTLSSNIEKGNFTFQFTYIELVLAQDAILNKMSNSLKMSLLKEAIIKYQNKQQYFDLFGNLGLANSLFLCGRIMKSLNYQPFMLEINSNLFIDSFLKYHYVPIDNDSMNAMFSVILKYSNTLTS